MVMMKKAFFNLLALEKRVLRTSAQNEILSSSDISVCNVVSLFTFVTLQELISHITVRLCFSGGALSCPFPFLGHLAGPGNIFGCHSLGCRVLLLA